MAKVGAGDGAAEGSGSPKATRFMLGAAEGEARAADHAHVAVEAEEQTESARKQGRVGDTFKSAVQHAQDKALTAINHPRTGRTKSRLGHANRAARGYDRAVYRGPVGGDHESFQPLFPRG